MERVTPVHLDMDAVIGRLYVRTEAQAALIRQQSERIAALENELDVATAIPPHVCEGDPCGTCGCTATPD